MNEGYILPLLENSCRRFHKSEKNGYIHTWNGNPQVRNLHRQNKRPKPELFVRSCLLICTLYMLISHRIKQTHL